MKIVDVIDEDEFDEGVVRRKFSKLDIDRIRRRFLKLWRSSNRKLTHYDIALKQAYNLFHEDTGTTN